MVNNVNVLESPTWYRTGEYTLCSWSAGTTSSAYSGTGDSVSFSMGWLQSEWSSVQNYWADINSSQTITLAVVWEEGIDDFTVNGTTVPGNIVLTIPNSGYQHSVTATLGSHSYTSPSVIAAGVTSVSVPITYDWLNEMPSSITGSVSVRLQTIVGGQLSGEATHNATITCPNNSTTKPNISALSLNPNNLLADTYYVQGKTSISPTVTSSGNYSATIVSRSYSLNGTTYGYGDRVAISASGSSVPVSVTVTDSRGLSDSISTTVNVYAYTNPVISLPSVFRCNSSGVSDDEGTYGSFSAVASVTQIGSANTYTLSVKTKLTSSPTYGAETTLTSGVASILQPFATTSAYDVMFMLTDAVGTTTTYLSSISTSGYLMFIRRDGTGAAFGKACEHQNALEIPANWDFYKGNSIIGGINMDLVYPVGSIYMSMNSTNPATLFGVGTWERIRGRFLLGVDNTSGYAVGDTGGEATHTLTYSEMPKHVHNYHTRVNWYDTASTTNTLAVNGVAVGASVANGHLGVDRANTQNTYDAGNGVAHNNMPPYLAVYIWKRTA